MNDIRRVLSYNDILLCPRNSELEHISEADIMMNYKTNIPFKAIPVINAPMDTVCSINLLNCLSDYNMPTTVHRFFNSAKEQIDFVNQLEKKDGLRIHFVSVGIIDKWKDWIDEVLDCPFIYNILVDVANGDTRSAVNTVKYIREQKPLYNIMAGNVATKSGFIRLQEAGANFIRVGIGGGSICSTRINTGFGMPTLTSIFDCAKVKDTAYLVADGGIENNGDICKAIKAGADMVMAGKLFASTSLAGNEKYDKDGELIIYRPDLNARPKAMIIKEGENIPVECFPPLVPSGEIAYCNYHGMASEKAINKLSSKKSSVSVEGVAGLIPYQGTTEDVIKGMRGNLQSAVAYYAGCRNWQEFQRKVKIVEITQQGYEESKTRVVNL